MTLLVHGISSHYSYMAGMEACRGKILLSSKSGRNILIAMDCYVFVTALQLRVPLLSASLQKSSITSLGS
jgi:hypothetical protein